LCDGKPLKPFKILTLFGKPLANKLLCLTLCAVNGQTFNLMKKNPHCKVCGICLRSILIFYAKKKDVSRLGSTIVMSKSKAKAKKQSKKHFITEKHRVKAAFPT